MANPADPPLHKNDIYWKILDDSIQRLGELSLTDEIFSPNDHSLMNDWDRVRAWRSNSIDQKYHEKLIEIYQEKVLKPEEQQGLSLQDIDKRLVDRLNNDSVLDSDFQDLLKRCILSLGMQKLSYWSLIPWLDLSNWYLFGVPKDAQESVVGLQEVILSGLEKEISDNNSITSEGEETESLTRQVENATHSIKPQLQIYREVYSSFYDDILTQDVQAIFEAEEEMVNSNLIIGQQIYRVRAILAVYSQRKFLEWLKGICCKICNISWRKAYDLMYAYESRRFIERNQPDLLKIFDYQIQRFQCEARRYITDLIPILEEAKDNNKRFTLEEVKELFPPDKIKPPEETYVSELRLSLKRLLDESLISDLSNYIQKHPGETFQSILDSALRNWLIQQA